MADTKGYIAGDYNAYCDYCEGQYLASQLKEDYWGFRACPKDYTKPNPQMFVRPAYEKITVPWARPVDGTDQFILGVKTATNFTQANNSLDPTVGILYCYCVGGFGLVNFNLPDPNTLPNIEYKLSIVFLNGDGTNLNTASPLLKVTSPGTLRDINGGILASIILNSTGFNVTLLMNRAGRYWRVVP